MGDSDSDTNRRRKRIQSKGAATRDAIARLGQIRAGKKAIDLYEEKESDNEVSDRNDSDLDEFVVDGTRLFGSTEVTC